MEITLTVRLTEEEIRHAIEDYLTVKGIRANTIKFDESVTEGIIAYAEGVPVESTKSPSRFKEHKLCHLPKT